MTLTPGEAMNALRNMQEMSLQQLSTLTGLEEVILIEMENSSDDLTGDMAVILAKAFRTFLALLLYGINLSVIS